MSVAWVWSAARAPLSGAFKCSITIGVFRPKADIAYMPMINRDLKSKAWPIANGDHTKIWDIF